MKKKIAILSGGYSGEAEVSFKSAQMILNNIDRNKYEPYEIKISKNNWSLNIEDKTYEIDKNDFSALVGNNKLTFDGVFVIIHGTPGENGLIQGYFDMIGMPYTTGGVWSLGTTFNKSACNKFIEAHGYKVAKNIHLYKNDVYSSTDISALLGLPVFVKPNNGGSSLAISKVDHKEGLHEAINLAFTVDNQVILEEFLQGTEVTCGVITQNHKVMALPITEIVAHREFFDYEAKYQGASEEITPARIMEDAKNKVQRISEELYKLLDCRGMIRVDFIIRNEEPYVIEINGVPGFSEQSIIPQQAEAAGMSKTQLISNVIESTIG